MSAFLIKALAAAAVAVTPSPPAQPRLDPVATPPAEPFISPATIDNSIESTGPAMDARQLRTRMAVGVSVNTRGPFRFIVDSGADRSVIGAGLAEELGLPTDDEVILHSMSGTTKVGTVRLDSLKVGGSESQDVIAPTLPEAFLGAQGLIGIDALASQRLTMDFEKKTITIHDNNRAETRASAPDEIIVTARRRKGQLILTQVAIGRDSLSAVIDTGAEVTIGNAALRAKLVGRKAKLEQITLVSVTGQTVVADMVLIPEMRIGELIMRNVPVAFAEVPPFALFGLSKQPAMLLGTDVLQVFRRVSLDFRNKKVGFRLRA